MRRPTTRKRRTKRIDTGATSIVEAAAREIEGRIIKKDLSEIIYGIDDAVFWWRLERRKNAPGTSAPHPINGTHLFVATVGQHKQKGKLQAGWGHSDVPASALQAALVRAGAKP